ncbi:MAG: hypothetical protein KTV77_03730 [Wolbachia endosymbiont of Fragariocoptes setiger]|nr:hypothetical protein [Wolbachia endosymbiont of Fragariocoptes setiger]
MFSATCTAHRQEIAINPNVNMGLDIANNLTTVIIDNNIIEDDKTREI